MSMFEGLSSEGHQETEDRLGGFSALDSDAYDFTIMFAYAHVADSGAKALALELDANGKKYNETVYVTNKNGENWYWTDKEKKETKASLPGFITIEEICQVTVGKGLKDLVFEDKMANIYDKDAKKEVPKSVKAAVELIGKQVTLGILNTLEDKTKWDESAKKSVVVPGETRVVNSINKVFHYPTHVTVPEARHAAEKGTTPTSEFYDKWVEKNKGKQIDKTTKGPGGVPKSGKPAGAAPQAGASTTKSLF